MPTRRAAPLKKLRYYLSQLPPENLLPHKKLNATARAGLDGKLKDGLAATLEDLQMRMLAAYVDMKHRRGEGL